MVKNERCKRWRIFRRTKQSYALWYFRPKIGVLGVFRILMVFLIEAGRKKYYKDAVEKYKRIMVISEQYVYNTAKSSRKAQKIQEKNREKGDKLTDKQRSKMNHELGWPEHSRNKYEISEKEAIMQTNNFIKQYSDKKIPEIKYGLYKTNEGEQQIKKYEMLLEGKDPYGSKASRTVKHLAATAKNTINEGMEFVKNLFK